MEEIVNLSHPVTTLITGIGVGLAIVTYFSQFTKFQSPIIAFSILLYILVVLLFTSWLRRAR